MRTISLTIKSAVRGFQDFRPGTKYEYSCWYCLISVLMKVFRLLIATHKIRKYTTQCCAFVLDCRPLFLDIAVCRSLLRIGMCGFGCVEMKQRRTACFAFPLDGVRGSACSLFINFALATIVLRRHFACHAALLPLA